jgi:hypothetical protein
VVCSALIAVGGWVVRVGLTFGPLIAIKAAAARVPARLTQRH